eukprot:5017887-Amphidinium_carterae.1
MALSTRYLSLEIRQVSELTEWVAIVMAWYLVRTDSRSCKKKIMELLDCLSRCSGAQVDRHQGRFTIKPFGKMVENIASNAASLRDAVSLALLYLAICPKSDDKVSSTRLAKLCGIKNDVIFKLFVDPVRELQRNISSYL